MKLPGAIRVPPYAIDSVAIPSGSDIVAYDSDPNELVSTHVAAELLRKGIKIQRPQRRGPRMARRQLSDRNEGSATLGPARTRIPQQGLVAASLAAVAFLCYYATLVPGLDLGDSASFQTGVGSLTLTPRHAYPLYYGLGSVVRLAAPWRAGAGAQPRVGGISARSPWACSGACGDHAVTNRSSPAWRRGCFSPFPTPSGARPSRPRSTRCTC